MTLMGNSRSETWTASYNVKNFDLVTYLNNHDQFGMKKTRPLQDGDYVYLYTAKPYGYVMYYCEVVNVNVDDAELRANEYARVSKTVHVVDI